MLFMLFDFSSDRDVRETYAGFKVRVCTDATGYRLVTIGTTDYAGPLGKPVTQFGTVEIRQDKKWGATEWSAPKITWSSGEGDAAVMGAVFQLASLVAGLMASAK